MFLRGFIKLILFLIKMKFKWLIFGIIVFLISLIFDEVILRFFTGIRILRLNDIITQFSVTTSGFFSLVVTGLAILIWKRKYIFSFFNGFSCCSSNLCRNYFNTTTKRNLQSWGHYSHSRNNQLFSRFIWSLQYGSFM